MPRLSVLLLLLLLSALSLSEGRALSRCELRDQLLPLVQLTGTSQRNRLRVMARVICEVERFSSLNTDIIREYEKEIFDLDDPTTTTATTTTASATSATTTTASAATATTTTTAPATSATTTTASATSATTTTATTAPATSATTTTASATTTAPTTSSPRPPTAANTTTTSRTSPVAVARRRRAVVSDVLAKFFGIFQFSDRTHCNSGYGYSSEDKCQSDCNAFLDEDISNDLECFVQSRLFWAVFRGASSSCRSRRTQNDFFRACDAGETAPPPNRLIARVFMSGGSYK